LLLADILGVIKGPLHILLGIVFYGGTLVSICFSAVQKDSSPANAFLSLAGLTGQHQKASIFRDRLKILVPGAPLTLAKRSQIMLDLGGLPLREVDVVQYSIGVYSPGEERPLKESLLSILRTANGKPYIEITPLAMGTIKLKMITRFAEDGIAVAEAQVAVGPTTEKPTAFTMSCCGGGRNTTSETLVWIHKDNRKGIFFAEANFDNSEDVIKIPWSELNVRLKISGTDEIMTFDAEKGLATPISPGHALLTTKYNGVVNRACIMVKVANDFRFMPGFDCKDLLRPGQHLGNE
jgi:hypothetical protein